MEEIKNEVVQETIEETEGTPIEEEVEETPKYILHTPKAPDVFVMAGIIGKIGVNKFAGLLKKDEIQDLTKKIIDKNRISSEDMSLIAGIGVFTEVAQIILASMDKCEEDVYKLLSNTSNLSVEEVKDLDGVTFVEMIIDFFKRNTDFIKAASKYVK